MMKFTLASACLALAASFVVAAPQDDQYVLGPDSQVKPDVPHGKVEQLKWETSKAFPGTSRDWWIYVPAQYDAAKPACLMVFQDGAGCVKADGGFRAPVVFDNLIAAGQMPVTIGVFISPGSFPAAKPGDKPRSNRSFEYDSLGGLYSQFLLEEILPEVKKKYNVTDDPEGRAISGSSSGAICAFTVAWEHPESFRKVYSTIGSYTNIRGGNVYPALVRKTQKKPIRIFLADGKNDIVHGPRRYRICTLALDAHATTARRGQLISRGLEFCAPSMRHKGGRCKRSFEAGVSGDSSAAHC